MVIVMGETKSTKKEEVDENPQSVNRERTFAIKWQPIYGTRKGQKAFNGR
jgi:hypothetical protein